MVELFPPFSLTDPQLFSLVVWDSTVSRVCRNEGLREIDFLFTSLVVMHAYRCMGAFDCVISLQRNNNQITI